MKISLLIFVNIVLLNFSLLGQLTDRGLIAHYSFETDASNQVSDAFDLTPIAHTGSNLPTYNSADGRSFVSTDGTNSLFNESELANFLQNAHDKSFSISFWMRSNNLAPSTPPTRTYLEAFRSLYIRRSNTEFGVGVGSEWRNIESTVSANGFVWRHYAIVFDANKGSLRGYINNVLIGEDFFGVAPAEIFQHGDKFSIASRYNEFGNSTDRLAADFSDMYLYNRALTPSDIESLYNNESPIEHTLSKDDLLAHYNFETDGSNNFSGNFHLTPHGTTPTINSGGVVGNAVEFNGFGAFFNDNEFGDFYSNATNKSISVSFWVKLFPDQNNTTTNTYAEMFESLFFRGTERARAGYKPVDGNWQQTQTQPLPTPYKFEHIVFVLDLPSTGMGSMKLYRNNVLEWNTTPPNTNPIEIFNNAFVVGAGQVGGVINYATKGFKGLIDEMFIFNRTLDHNDINALFNKVEPQSTTFYELTFSDGANGSLVAEVSGAEIISGDNIQSDATITFSATPDAGFKVEEWTVNGSAQDTQSNTFVLEGLSDATNVSVSFEAIPANSSVVDFSVIGGSGNLTASVDGSAIVPGQAIANGEDIVFTANPNSEYRVMHWLVDGTEVVGNTTTEYILSNLSANTMVEVEFEIRPIEFFDLTFSAGDNGDLTAVVDGQTVISGNEVQGGKNIEFTAAPPSGFKVLRWSLNGQVLTGETGNTYLLEDVEGNVHVAVSFTEELLNTDGLLAFYDFENSPENRFLDDFHMSYTGTGTPQYVTGAGEEGLAIKFDGTNALINEDELHDYFNAATDKSISISFWAKADQAISLAETTLYDAFNGFYADGAWPSFRVSAVDNQAQGIASNFPVDLDTWRHFTIAYNANTSKLTLYRNGAFFVEITTDAGGNLILYNTLFTIGVGVTSGIIDWANKNFPGAIDDFYVFNRALTSADAMDLFNRKTPRVNHTIAYNVTAGSGELSAFVDNLTFESGYEALTGETITFEASPDAGFKVEQWILNGQVLPTQNNTLIIDELSEDITLSVSFESIPANAYLIDFAVAGSNGAISAEVDGTAIVPGQAVADDKNVVFTATPDMDYEVLAWYVDGVQVAGQTGTEYILLGFSANVLVEVAFKPIGFVVEFNTTGNGSISAEVNSVIINSGDVTAIGESIVFTASPNAGFMLARWSVNGHVVAGEESATFTYTNIQENTTVSASFVASPMNNDGLVAYYNFEETPQNVISDNFHMSYIGTVNPVYVPGVNGEGKAIKFNGANALENDTELRNFFDNSTNKSMTVSYWVKTDGNVIPTTGFRTMFEAFTGLIARDRSLRVWANTTTFDDINSGVNVDDGNWRHITVAFNSGTSKLALYVNGNLHQEINTAGHQLTFSNNKFLIGVGMNSGINFGTSSFAGTFDDFYIYNKALTAAEVLELYQGWEMPEKRTVTFAVNGSNGELDATVNGQSFDSGYEVFEGETLVFYATPDPGYRVSQWSVNGIPVIEASGNTLNIPELNSDILVSVSFTEDISVSIHESFTNEKYSLVLYPNPANNYILVSASASISNYVIYDVFGMIIDSGNGYDNDVLKINTSNLTNGLYVIKITSSNKAITDRFVIKR
ncbi:LamG-like jellyroll fold domain-containing protein [Alkalitalea saponilacus]|uniref:Por secretion system C-terminal sorting domain-containing protein n=1 Tax=Alkalitalea saponilacus TaxID=889453 RepID=A0A1T5CP98_9BACT|nr:LamG-like jellyroll fold domain-containing protein [Alkalitalea saponilacus]ASB49927.1 hypothetical protein CDL62_12660 [Alkalitalea saponilacus]SKB60980.1 Por secretion system C-terminal sorting domain-containing protein [Alkalitalea saponilacus]